MQLETRESESKIVLKADKQKNLTTLEGSKRKLWQLRQQPTEVANTHNGQSEAGRKNAFDL